MPAQRAAQSDSSGRGDSPSRAAQSEHNFGRAKRAYRERATPVEARAAGPATRRPPDWGPCRRPSPDTGYRAAAPQPHLGRASCQARLPQFASGTRHRHSIRGPSARPASCQCPSKQTRPSSSLRFVCFHKAHRPSLLPDHQYPRSPARPSPRARGPSVSHRIRVSASVSAPDCPTSPASTTSRTRAQANGARWLGRWPGQARRPPPHSRVRPEPIPTRARASAQAASSTGP